jgi:hypothetical protein
VGAFSDAPRAAASVVVCQLLPSLLSIGCFSAECLAFRARAAT